MKGAFLLIASGWLTFMLCGQTPEFEVASIKPNPSLPLMKIGPSLAKGGANGTRVTLKDLLMAAYDMPAPRIVGPSWLDGDRFDVIAKASRDGSQDELRAMLQTLLKQRFHLVTHTETRELVAYDLVAAKGGVKMTPQGAPAPDHTPPVLKYPGVKNIASMGGTLTLAQVANFLSAAAGKPVLDKTGLDGKYNFFLAYMPNVLPDGGGAEFGPPDLFTAIQEQMGLRLQPTKAELTVIAVDQMDRMPTEN